VLGGEKRRKKGCEVDDEKWVGFGYLAKAGDKNRGFGHLRKRVTDPREISLRVGREGGVCKEAEGREQQKVKTPGPGHPGRQVGQAGERKEQRGEAEVRQCGSARQSGNGSK
jgi:hypothetical protein